MKRSSIVSGGHGSPTSAVTPTGTSRTSTNNSKRNSRTGGNNTIVLYGEGASIVGKKFIDCFSQLVSRNSESRNNRRREWLQADAKNNGYLSITDFEIWILWKLESDYGPIEGKQYFIHFRTIYSLGFQIAVQATTTSAVASIEDNNYNPIATTTTSTSTDRKNDDNNTNELTLCPAAFRLCVAHLCIYALMYDAFTKINNVIGCHNNNDENDNYNNTDNGTTSATNTFNTDDSILTYDDGYEGNGNNQKGYTMALEEWKAGYRSIATHGLIALSNLVTHNSTTNNSNTTNTNNSSSTFYGVDTAAASKVGTESESECESAVAAEDLFVEESAAQELFEQMDYNHCGYIQFYPHWCITLQNYETYLNTTMGELLLQKPSSNNNNTSSPASSTTTSSSSFYYHSSPSSSIKSPKNTTKASSTSTTTTTTTTTTQSSITTSAAAGTSATKQREERKQQREKQQQQREQNRHQRQLQRQQRQKQTKNSVSNDVLQPQQHQQEQNNKNINNNPAIDNIIIPNSNSKGIDRIDFLSQKKEDLRVPNNEEAGVRPLFSSQQPHNHRTNHYESNFNDTTIDSNHLTTMLITTNGSDMITPPTCDYHLLPVDDNDNNQEQETEVCGIIISPKSQLINIMNCVFYYFCCCYYYNDDDSNMQKKFPNIRSYEQGWTLSLLTNCGVNNNDFHNFIIDVQKPLQRKNNIITMLFFLVIGIVSLLQVLPSDLFQSKLQPDIILQSVLHFIQGQKLFQKLIFMLIRYSVNNDDGNDNDNTNKCQHQLEIICSSIILILLLILIAIFVYVLINIYCNYYTNWYMKNKVVYKWKPIFYESYDLNLQYVCSGVPDDDMNASVAGGRRRTVYSFCCCFYCFCPSYLRFDRSRHPTTTTAAMNAIINADNQQQNDNGGSNAV